MQKASPAHPWLSLWIHPRKTIRDLIDAHPKWLILWIAIIGGIISTFTWATLAWTRYPTSSHPTAITFIVLIVVGVILGLIHLYFASWLYRLTGSWLGGKGSFTAVKCAVGWSNYPFAIVGLLNIAASLSIFHLWLMVLFTLLNVIGLVWSIIIFFKVLAESMLFSVWRAIGAVLIAFVLIFVVFMIISLLIPLMQPLFH